MPPLTRSRRLQAGLFALSMVSALGAAVGLGLTTHTQSSQSSQPRSDGTNGSGAAGTTSQHSDGGDDEGDDESDDESGQQSSPVTPPSDSTPQATTGGS